MSGTEDSPAEPNQNDQKTSRRPTQGPVMPIGGAEDKQASGDQEHILTRFVELAGGKKARILVIPTASEVADEMGQRYADVFGKIGAKSVDVLNVQKREDANAQPALDQINEATGIFITGGSQSRLVSYLSGTHVMERIRERNANGVIVAGTSAGASIVASHLMLGGTGLTGNSSDSSARKHMVELAAGFGLLQDVVVDQHFSQRGRMGRLLSVYAANPGLLGIGLDEDTAVLIDHNGLMEVLGSGMVTVIDGRNSVSDYFEREVGEVLTVGNSHLFVLGPGRFFNLREREIVMDGSTIR
jgi:cyanophycinase